MINKMYIKRNPANSLHYDIFQEGTDKFIGTEITFEQASSKVQDFNDYVENSENLSYTLGTDNN